jgi:hypothetical protein
MSDHARPSPDEAARTAGDLRSLVARLGRPHASGGTVVERAALMAEGADFGAAVTWILAHGGEPETAAASAPRRGLYGPRSDSAGGAAGSGTPQRFVLPAGALTP